MEFVRVLPNLVSGPALFPTNLAPDVQIQVAFPSMPLLATLTRPIAMALGGAAIFLSVLAARRADGWPAAVVLGVAATLLLPSATWYHYLAPLLPIAAFAWPRATQRARATLLAGAALITLGLLSLPLAIAGAATVVVGALSVLWPRRREASA
jgi:hypothetical protein